MRIKPIRKAPIKIKQFALKHKLITSLVILLPVIGFFAYYFSPKNVQYSFSGNTCYSAVTLLPSSLKNQNDQFTMYHDQKISLLGQDILARKTCFKLANITDENQIISYKAYPFDFSLLAQRFNIQVPSFPTVAKEKVDLAAVPIVDQINLPLDKKDEHFEYSMAINEAKTNCLPKGAEISCSIKDLNLKHNSTYTAQINRYFNGQQINADKLELKTVEPVIINSSSIAQGEEVYRKVSDLTVEADRQIESVEGLVLTTGESVVETNYEVLDNKINIKLPANMLRGADYKLTIEQITGLQSETLPDPYLLNFKLMNGPSISGSSLYDRATPLSANITVYFNQSINSQDYKNIISLKQNGQNVQFSHSVSGGKIFIYPANNFIRCAELQLKIAGIVANQYGVTNEINWQQSSRARCATSFSLGSSLEGRAILGYKFGGGTKEVLYIGAMHGDEYNSKRILEEWMWEIEGNPGRIPSGVTVTVVPVVNPDGIAKGTRNNARNVDLNRNFPANNWKSDVKIQNGSILENGGGESPLSEPESQTIANYITNNSPNLILTYHSQGSIVESNEAGIANSKTRAYANLSGYGYKLASQNKDFFNYDVNGSMEEWAKDKLGLPVILVELSTRIYHDFSRNKAAMWAML